MSTHTRMRLQLIVNVRLCVFLINITETHRQLANAINQSNSNGLWKRNLRFKSLHIFLLFYFSTTSDLTKKNQIQNCQNCCWNLKTETKIQIVSMQKQRQMGLKYRSETKNQLQIMNYDQIKNLFQLLSEELIISCEIDSSQSLVLSLMEIIVEMQTFLENERVPVRDIRLIGGAATHVIAHNSTFPYNDIDVVFTIETRTNLEMMNRIRLSVLSAIGSLISKNKKQYQTDLYPERYIKKQVCIQSLKSSDYWSLFSLGCFTNTGHNNSIVELKFASSTERQYECSIDSFQIVLNPALHFINQHSSTISKGLYPIVVMESTWGCVKEALKHLHNKQIVLDKPEQIRGGGLLKYCKLLVNGFQPHPDLDENSVKRYMCSRFFIDFPFLNNQHAKIISYMANHFQPRTDLYIDFLQHLADIISNSSVHIDIDRLRTIFLINSISQQIWDDSIPKISLDFFEDRKRWSVGEIVFGSCDSSIDSISSSSSISTPSENLSEHSLETDSLHDDSSIS